MLILGEPPEATLEQVRETGRTADLSPAPGLRYDAVVVLDAVTPLETAAGHLVPRGMLFWCTGEPREPWAARLASAGLRVYDDPGTPEDAPCTAVHQDYDPLDHAVALRESGRTDWAVEVLRRMPETFYADPFRQVAACVEHQRCLLLLARGADDAGLSLSLFFRAQKAFFRAVYIDPHAHEAYRVQAEFWTHIGRPDRAVALLRGIQFSAPDEDCAAQLAVLGTPPPPPPCAVPTLETPRATPRMLALVIPGYDPGMDILYDGLRTVLGAEGVVEYPWKPLLHGERHEEADGYPTTFRHPGAASDLDGVCTQLEAGAFDAILYADLLRTLPLDALRRVLRSAGNTPLFIVDGWDDASNNLPMMLEHLAVEASRVFGYFKREMIAGVDYGAKAIPLPLAYPDGRVPAVFPARRERALFWAGNRYYGLRRLYLEYVEAATGLRLDTKYTQEDYARALDHTVLGLSLCGFGFDTIRYWEVPAHGGVLLAEHPPIVIPHDFTDLENAVLFRDVPELLARLAWCLGHTGRLPEIAAAGHRHFLAHHTASARARQLLAHMERALREHA